MKMKTTSGTQPGFLASFNGGGRRLVRLCSSSEIDGSAATGKLLITTDATVDKLTGGSADDTFTLTSADFGSTNADEDILPGEKLYKEGKIIDESVQKWWKKLAGING